jgi:hypothetical protein
MGNHGGRLCVTSEAEDLTSAALAQWQVAQVRTQEAELPAAERCLKQRVRLKPRARLAPDWAGCLRRDAARPAQDASAFRAAWAARACQ